MNIYIYIYILVICKVYTLYSKICSMSSITHNRTKNNQGLSSSKALSNSTGKRNKKIV